MANNNVLFKRGLQAELANVTTVDNGAFYLTTDTHKLYYGYNDKLNLLDSVIVVENLPSTSDKIEVGYFYYATATNVLAIYDGTSWTQVNPDSKLVITGFTTGVKLDSNTATVTHTLTGKDEKGADVLNIAPTFSIKGEDGITVAIDGTTITLKGTVPEYTLSTPASEDGAAIKLNLDGAEDSAVAITGTGAAKVSATENAIVIGAKNTEVTGVEFAAGASGEGIDLAITNKTTNADGTTEETIIKNNFDIGVFYSPSYDNEGNKTYNNSANIIDGIINLDVYNVDQINALIYQLQTKMNAMEFRGAVANLEELNNKTTDIDQLQVGDTFKASGNFTLKGVEVKTGDLLIVEDFEYGNDTETGNNVAIIEWAVIPSGDDAVLTYDLGLDANGKITLNENGSEKSALSIIDEEGNPVQIKIDTANKTVTVVHATKTQEADGEAEAITQTSGASQEFTIVADVEADEYGHLNKLTTQKITVVDTKVTGVTEEVENTDAGIKIGTSIAQTTGDPITTEYYIESSSLSIREGEVNDNKVLVDLVWGSF